MLRHVQVFGKRLATGNWVSPFDALMPPRAFVKVDLSTFDRL